MPQPTHSASTNPYIPKGDGPAPVEAYLAAMPGWKQPLGRQIDAIVTGAYPNVRKQVRWDTPFWGKEDGWFLAIYCYKSYLQISFLTGAGLDPLPPKPSKDPATRYLDLREGEALDAEQLAHWIAQALRLPGRRL